MAALLIEPTEIIEVEHIPILIYGPPGIGKTSMAQTSAEPITLDFDKGIHRSAFRQRAYRFDSWSDCLQAQREGLFAEYRTIVLDTLGALLVAMSRDIMAESGKNATGGGLSISGWGVLGNRFGMWIKTLVAGGQDIVMVCHEQEDKDVGGNRYLRPQLPGKMAWDIVHQMVDLMAHVDQDGRNRKLNFSPTEYAIGKNAAGWEPLPVPKLESSPRFLADRLADANTRIGKTAAASAHVATLVHDWIDWLAQTPPLEEFNQKLPVMKELPSQAKRQVWNLLLNHAKGRKWEWVVEQKQFVQQKEQAA